jgi:septal ring factor EnvC (AmiA/AmiB activator)
MTEVLTCAYCGKQFRAKIRSGPPPKYCSQAHRQRAYQQRKRTATPEQIEQLEARVRSLEYDNRKLRQALDDAEAYAQRLEDELRPPSPNRQHLYGIDPTPIPETTEPPARWRRGRRPS